MIVAGVALAIAWILGVHECERRMWNSHEFVVAHGWQKDVFDAPSWLFTLAVAMCVTLAAGFIATGAWSL